MDCHGAEAESFLLYSCRIPGQHSDRKLVLGKAYVNGVFLGSDPVDGICRFEGV